MVVTKDGRTMSLRDEHQLAAFLNNGWKKAEDAPKKAKAVKVEETEVAEEKPVEEEKPKTTTTTRRKRTTTKAE